MGVHDILWCRSQLYDGCARVLYFPPPSVVHVVDDVVDLACRLCPPSSHHPHAVKHTHAHTQNVCVWGRGGGRGESRGMRNPLSFMLLCVSPLPVPFVSGSTK